jgi:hypothetical protein
VQTGNGNQGQEKAPRWQINNGLLSPLAFSMDHLILLYSTPGKSMGRHNIIFLP